MLAAGASYDVTRTFRLPQNLSGDFYVFVVTDPARSVGDRGAVFENGRELDNSRASAQPILIELPPPADLVVTTVNAAGGGEVGSPITVTYTCLLYTSRCV